MTKSQLNFSTEGARQLFSILVQKRSGKLEHEKLRIVTKKWNSRDTRMAQLRELAGNPVLLYWGDVLIYSVQRQRVRSHNLQIHARAGNPPPAGEGFPFPLLSLIPLT